MELIEIKLDSSLYQEELKLRNEILRQPLGMSIYDDDLSAEAKAQHFGITHNNMLIACLLIFPKGDNLVRLKQMTVSLKYQGIGVGAKLMRDTENILSQNGTCEIQLAARKTAIGFYQKLNYAIFGKEFIEVSLPHMMMNKCIE